MTELTAKQLSTIQTLLTDLQQEIDQLLTSSKDAARPVALDQPIGRLSRMDAMQQQSMLSANRTAARKQLELINAALRRLKEGDYGNCLVCEEPIPFSRLEVKPESPLCIDCQRLNERR